MSHRFISSRARSVLLVGTLASAVVVANTLPVLMEASSIAQAGPRKSQSQAVGTERKKSRKNQRNVTKTFSSDAAISIPNARVADTNGPANPYPSRVPVAGIKQGRVVDVNLTLRGFSHTFPADVDILLVAPNGTNAIVLADVGDSDGDESVTDLTITLDDEAAAPMPEEALLTSGSFRPTDGDLPGPDGEIGAFPAPAPAASGAAALSTFDGIDPNGEWQLFILDDDGNDTGELASGWSLEITASSKTKSHQKKGKH